MENHLRDGSAVAGSMERCPGNGGRPDGSSLRVAQWVRVRWWNASAWYAVTLAEALIRRGHVSWVLAPPETPAAREAVRRGIPTPDVGDPGSFRPIEFARSESRLADFLRRERCDLINVHSGPGHPRFALLCRRLGIPLVRTRSDVRPPRGGALQGWLYRTWTDHHLAAAEFIRREHYRILRIPPERVAMLRGGIDAGALDRISRPEARARVRSRLGVPADAPLVGMIARLSPVKGHAHFLNAMARVALGRPGVHVVLAGPEVEVTRAELEEISTALGLGGRVHIVGKVEDPLIWSAALDVAAIASVDSEAICRSAFELLGLGVPLVATEVHAIPEVVVPGTGLIVPPGDPERMAGAIGLLLDSAALRASFGEAGREHVRRHYTLETFGDFGAELFREVIASRRHRREGLRLEGAS